jgi:virginiamycin B lyase
MTLSGHITQFPVGGTPGEITVGPDSALWFTEGFPSLIGRVTLAGVLTEFPLPSDSVARSITPGPDGNLWFTQSSPEAIVRMTPSGQTTTFPLSTGYLNPTGIVGGPDGNLWYTEDFGIGRITPAGLITDFPLPLPRQPYRNFISLITLGPDGNLWFTEGDSNRIGRCTSGR